MLPQLSFPRLFSSPRLNEFLDDSDDGKDLNEVLYGLLSLIEICDPVIKKLILKEIGREGIAPGLSVRYWEVLRNRS